MLGHRRGGLEPSLISFVWGDGSRSNSIDWTLSTPCGSDTRSAANRRHHHAENEDGCGDIDWSLGLEHAQPNEPAKKHGHILRPRANEHFTDTTHSDSMTMAMP